MYSSPIDLPAQGPKPKNSASTGSEPDSRFSELLRGPSDTGPDRPDSAASGKSTQVAPAERPSEADAGSEVPGDPARTKALDPATDTTAPDTPVPDTVGPAPVDGLSEAITWAQPQGAIVAEGVPAAPLSSGIPFAQPPESAGRAVMPSTASAGPEQAAVPPGQTVTMPAAAFPPIPAMPAEIPGPAGMPAHGTIGTATVAPAIASPATAAQPVMATAAPVAAGKSASHATSPIAAAAKSGTAEGKSADPATPADRPVSAQPAASTAAPERLAAATASAKSAVEVPLPNDAPDRPPLAPKAGPDPSRAVLTPAAPKAVIEAAVPPAGDAQATARATTVPSTVVETADAALSGSPAEPPAASHGGQIVRMTSSAVSVPHPGHNPAAAQPAAEQVVLQVQRAVREGVDRLTMQLKPASLGRVDIQMEVGFDGRLQAVISAERPETLHLLQRDARALTEALNDAGLQTDSGSLSFNLREQAGDHSGGGDSGTSDGTAAAPPNAADDSGAATTEITLTLGDGRVDIKV